MGQKKSDKAGAAAVPRRRASPHLFHEFITTGLDHYCKPLYKSTMVRLLDKFRASCCIVCNNNIKYVGCSLIVETTDGPTPESLHSDMLRDYGGLAAGNGKKKAIETVAADLKNCRSFVCFSCWARLFGYCFCTGERLTEINRGIQKSL